jgi:hypothetical protein
MPCVARTNLTIFMEGQESPGVIVYGLGAPGSIKVEPSAYEWAARRTTSVGQLSGHNWQVVLWEVRLVPWPNGSAWDEVLERTLDSMLDAGATIAWVGAEGIPFADPPDLFTPEHMHGGVLVWRSTDGGGGQLDPDRPLSPVPDEELNQLRAEARGLADAE